MMTESEALGTACPILSATIPVAGISRKCMGSQCQLWRWRMYDQTAPIPQPIKEAGGYCGLGGKP